MRIFSTRPTYASLVLAAVLFLGACAGVPQQPMDPLLDKVYRSSDQTEISREQLLEEMLTADVIYLGERHDNPRHHELQLELLQELVARGRKPALGLEVFYLGQTSTLMSYAGGSGKHGGVSEDDKDTILRNVLGWGGENRDEDWSFYGPLVRFARDNDLTVFGMDLSRSIRRRITRSGIAGLTNVERSQLDRTDLDDPIYSAYMREQFVHAHCGYSKQDYLDRLYENWLARNDAMAMAITETLKEQDGEPVVAVLGAGHTQHNMAVYERVAYRRPTVRQVNLGFRQVADEPRPAKDYLASLEYQGRTFAPDHEYIWFTPRSSSSREDPCKAYLKHKRAQEEKKKEEAK